MAATSIEESLLLAAAKQAITPAAKLLKAVGLENYRTLTAKFRGAFQGHLDFVVDRCSKIKNILYRDDSILLNSQYVNVSFSTGRGTSVSDSEALSAIIEGKRTLISGTAGAGKTMFMRWAALRLIAGAGNHGRIPLFLEMRYLEEDAVSAPLEKYIYDKTSSEEASSAYPTFLEGLRSGVFIVLFDALDEVNPRFHPQLINRILNFTRKYPLVGFAASTRLDESTESLQDFTVLRTKPMTQTQISKVIRNLEWNEEVKAKLIARLEAGLYVQLQEFLSNPLLATIMLLAFDYSGDIPTKLTAFYQQAFDALYQRHDAAKGAYKRDHSAGLPIDRFENVFATFSFQTYLTYKFEFSDSDLLLAFGEACAYNQETLDPQLIVDDCHRAVCLFQKEGLDNIFAHRSFQEYFCALFIARYRESDVSTLIDAVSALDGRSSVLRMLYQLAPEVVEYEWILPLLRTYLSDFGRLRINTKTGLSKTLAYLALSIDVDPYIGSVETLTWSYSNPTAKGSSRWISTVSTITDGRIPFFLGLNETPLWDDFEDFLQGIPKDIGIDTDHIRSRVKSSIDDAGRRDAAEIEITYQDANWLIYSRMPQNLEILRASVKSYHDDIIRRRKERGAKVANLLTRPRRRSFSST